MHDLRDLKPSDAKTAAKRLATALKNKKIDLSHGECLDLVARMFGLRDWNVMAAKLAGAASAPPLLEAPPGWTVEGFNLSSFTGGVHPEEKHRGRPVFWLSNLEGETGNATVFQRVLAGSYAGKRVRFSAWLRTENVGLMASIALGTVDKQGFYLKLTNLERTRGEGPLRGTTGWSYRALVLDVPPEAHSLYYAFALRSTTGEARFSGLELEIVGADIPLTKPDELDAPANLDFTG